MYHAVIIFIIYVIFILCFKFLILNGPQLFHITCFLYKLRLNYTTIFNPLIMWIPLMCGMWRRNLEYIKFCNWFQIGRGIICLHQGKIYQKLYKYIYLPDLSIYWLWKCSWNVIFNNKKKRVLSDSEDKVVFDISY